MVNHMSGCKFCADLIRCDPHFHHHDKYMVCKIRNFINCFRTVSAFSGNDDFRTFFADFFQYFIDSFLKQITGIRVFRKFFFSVFQQVIKRAEGEGLFLFFKSVKLSERIFKAGFRTEVTGGAVFPNFYQQRIPVTVCRNGNDMLIIPACFTLEPEFLPGSAPEAGQSFFQGNLQTLPVHIGKG